MIKQPGLALGLAALLVGCGGDSSSRAPVQPPPPVVISGSAVKGPLIGANVTAFSIDPTAADLKGDTLATGETDQTAQITGMDIDGDTTGLVLLEFTADADTVDLTTGAAPVLTTLVTFASVDALAAGAPIYATPLTTMVMGIAADNADTAGVFGGNDDGSVTQAELLSSIEVAENQVKSSLGFGLIDDIQVFAIPPLLNDATSTASQQAQVVSYRMANEMLTALTASIQEDAQTNGSTASMQDVLAALAADVADGSIDGNHNGEAIPTLAEVSDLAQMVTQDPSQLAIPGTEFTAADIVSLVTDEVTSTGTTVDVTALEDGTVANPTPEPASLAADSDADTVNDEADNCPGTTNTDQVDTDQDTLGNACDPDDDNDGVADAEDAFVLDPNESEDTDSDGVGNNADPDDDNDGVNDDVDDFPTDPSESSDNDGDGIGDNADTNDDGDTLADDVDNCPNVSNEDQADSDGDGVGDACDEDSGGVPGGNPSAAWNEFNWNEADWQ